MEEIARTLSILTCMVEELVKEVREKDPDNIVARNAQNFINKLRGNLSDETSNQDNSKEER